jgi:phosphatidylserine/phosphatidylglycerophosphate/cardiolipin synthase-like enzyme
MAKFPITFVYVLGEMNHTKAVIIDNKSIILGSSNFDVVSYYLEEEIVVALTDQDHVQTIQSELFSGLREAPPPRRLSWFKSVVVWHGFRVIEWLIQGYARLFKSA